MILAAAIACGPLTPTASRIPSPPTDARAFASYPHCAPAVDAPPGPCVRVRVNVSWVAPAEARHLTGHAVYVGRRARPDAECVELTRVATYPASTTTVRYDSNDDALHTVAAGRLGRGSWCLAVATTGPDGESAPVVAELLEAVQ